MIKASEIKRNLTENGMKDIYKSIEEQSINLIALTNKEFKLALDEKILYSIMTEQKSNLTCEEVLKAVIAHENYLLALKNNKAEIEKNIIKITMDMYKAVA